MQINISPILLKKLELVRTNSEIKFKIIPDDKNKYALSIFLENSFDLDKLFKWFHANSIIKTKVVDQSLPGSIPFLDKHVISDDLFDTYNHVYKGLEPIFREHYIKNLDRKKLIMFNNTPEIIDEFEVKNSFSSTISETQIIINQHKKKANIIISPELLIRINISSIEEGLTHRLEDFTTKLPAQYSHKDISTYLFNYLTDYSFRISCIKENKENFTVNF